MYTDHEVTNNKSTENLIKMNYTEAIQNFIGKFQEEYNLRVPYYEKSPDKEYKEKVINVSIHLSEQVIDLLKIFISKKDHDGIDSAKIKSLFLQSFQGEHDLKKASFELNEMFISTSNDESYSHALLNFFNKPKELIEKMRGTVKMESESDINTYNAMDRVEDYEVESIEGFVKKQKEEKKLKSDSSLPTEAVNVEVELENSKKDNFENQIKLKSILKKDMKKIKSKKQEKTKNVTFNESVTIHHSKTKTVHPLHLSYDDIEKKNEDWTFDNRDESLSGAVGYFFSTIRNTLNIPTHDKNSIDKLANHIATKVIDLVNNSNREELRANRISTVQKNLTPCLKNQSKDACEAVANYLESFCKDGKAGKENFLDFFNYPSKFLNDSNFKVQGEELLEIDSTDDIEINVEESEGIKKTSKVVLFDFDDTLSSGQQLGDKERTLFFPEATKKVMLELLNSGATVIISSGATAGAAIRSAIPDEILNNPSFYVYDKTATKNMSGNRGYEKKLNIIKEHLNSNNTDAIGVIVEDDGSVNVRKEENIVHIAVPLHKKDFMNPLDKPVSDNYINATLLPRRNLLKMKNKVEQLKPKFTQATKSPSAKQVNILESYYSNVQQKKPEFIARKSHQSAERSFWSKLSKKATITVFTALIFGAAGFAFGGIPLAIAAFGFGFLAGGVIAVTAGDDPAQMSPAKAKSIFSEENTTIQNVDEEFRTEESLDPYAQLKEQVASILEKFFESDDVKNCMGKEQSTKDIFLQKTLVCHLFDADSYNSNDINHLMMFNLLKTELKSPGSLVKNSFDLFKDCFQSETLAVNIQSKLEALSNPVAFINDKFPAMKTMNNSSPININVTEEGVEIIATSPKNTNVKAEDNNMGTPPFTTQYEDEFSDINMSGYHSI